MEETEKQFDIDGTVLSVVYRNEENGYTVLRLKTDGGTITAVGCLPGVIAGEGLSLSGSWSSHPSYGEQFKAESFKRRLPVGRKAIMEYLSCGAVRGVGPVLAEAIVTAFGDDALLVLSEDPERLAEVRGISLRKAREIGREFKRRAAVRILMEFLSEHGVEPIFAVKLYKCYGAEALEAVRDNPYILTHEYFGADFFKADALAQRLGFGEDSPERVEAAVIFELKHNLNNGHSFLPREKLIKATDQLIGAGYEAINGALGVLAETGEAVREEIAKQDAVYLTGVFGAEKYVAGRILNMATQKYDVCHNVDKLISDIEHKQGIVYADMQRKAVELAAESGVMVLTGGPGTGKTTSLMGIIALFERMGLDTVLTAPTGRASKRMSELTGRDASTIHRLLGAGYAPGSEELKFEYGEGNPLPADAIIVDETSMVDIMLMQSLLKAMKAGCRLVLVGDGDQLPSVGPGCVFSDVIRSGAVPVVVLTEIFRQARESAIVRNAHAINKGIPPELREGDGDFFLLKRPTKERTAQTIVELISKRLPENMGISPSQIQVLSPSRRGECGTVKLNKLLQEALNPPAENKREKLIGEYVLREGDRVMQIRNNYDIIWRNSQEQQRGEGVFNGDIGTLIMIDSQREVAVIDFDGRQAVYPFDMLFELELAYAMTVHKSQGSEYRAVILALSREVPILMTREVLYTAVTRAKELLILVGNADVPAKMTGNNRRARRYSGLKTRLETGV